MNFKHRLITTFSLYRWYAEYLKVEKDVFFHLPYKVRLFVHQIYWFIRDLEIPIGKFPKKYSNYHPIVFLYRDMVSARIFREQFSRETMSFNYYIRCPLVWKRNEFHDWKWFVWRSYKGF